MKILEIVKNFIKKNKKLVTVVSAMFCAVVLVAVSIAGTIAYLKASTGTVTNTFTVGNVSITLVESKTDLYGAPTSGTTTEGNEYKLIPGHTYTKDPKVTVVAGSEACYVFVKVVDGLKDIEDATTIANQILANGWTKLPDVDNVYYKNITAAQATAGQVLPVFANFKLKDDANVSAYATETNENAKIEVTAYAIQSDGLSTPEDAWTAGGWG